MSNVRTSSVFLSLCMLVAPLAALASPSVDSVVAQHFKAVGGEKLKAAKTLKITGTSYEGDKATPMTIQRSRPNKFRYDTQKDGVAVVKLFDGTNGWFAEGTAEPKKLEADKLAGVREKAEFDDVLFDAQKRGLKLALVGEEDVNGAKAFKLQLTRPNGDSETRFIDQKSFLEVKRITAFTWEGQRKERTAYFSDYRSVDGIMVNHLTEWEGQGVKGKTVLQEVRYNAPIDDSVYRLSGPRS